MSPLGVMGRLAPAGLAVLSLVAAGVVAVPPGSAAAAPTVSAAPALDLLPSALAPAPGARAWDATDGVLLWWTWDAAERPYAWRVVRSVGGASSTVTVEGWQARWSDVDLKPGQSVTYELTGVDASGQPVTQTSTASGTRDAVEWQQPAVANSTLIDGAVNRTDNTAWTGPTTSFMTSDFDQGLTSIGSLVRVGRLPSSGRVVVSSSPTGDQVELQAPGICPPAALVSGTGEIGKTVYTAWGVFREISATFDIRCGADGPVHRVVARQQSADLVPSVLGASTQVAVTPGQLATSRVTLTNSGAGDAVMGASTPAGEARVVKDDCVGRTLAPQQSCAVTLSFDTTGLAAGRVYTSLNTPVAGLPDSHSSFAIDVRSALAAPVMRLTGLGPGITVLRWQGGAPGAGDLAGYVVERSTDGGQWAEVARPAPNWALHEDRQVPPGHAASYRVRILSTTGELSEPSAVVDVKTPTSGLVSSLINEVTASSAILDDVPMLIPRGTYPVTSSGVAVAPDRAHLVLTTNATGRHQLLLTKLDGSEPRVVLSSDLSDDWFGQPHVSPDGGSVAFQRRASGPVGVIELASGAFRWQSHTGTLLGWSVDGRRLLMLGGWEAEGAQPATGLRWTDLDGSDWARIPGSELARDGSVSRTGDVVWSEGTTGSASIRMLRAGAVAPVTVLGPLACAPKEPVFDPTGTKIALQIFTGCGWAAGAYALDVANGLPVSGPGTPMARLTSYDSFRWLTTRSGAPSASITVPAVTGPSATPALMFSDPDDPVGGLSGSCSLDGGAWASCGPTHALSGLSGGTHTLAVRVSDPAGNVSSTATKSWTVDATAPTVALSSVASPLYAISTTLTMSGADSGGSVASYDVRERYAGPGGGFSGYVYPSVWQRLTSPRLTVKLTQGFTYCFSARTRDAVGNVSPWTAERCTVVALDDRAFGASKVARGSLSAYVFGTYSKTLAAGAYLSRTGISARRIGVIVTTCASCGPAEVWIGRTRLGVISTATTTAAYRRVIWLPKTTTLSGTLVVKATTTRPVIFDGVLVLK